MSFALANHSGTVSRIGSVEPSAISFIALGGVGISVEQSAIASPGAYALLDSGDSTRPAARRVVPSRRSISRHSANANGNVATAAIAGRISSSQHRPGFSPSVACSVADVFRHEHSPQPHGRLRRRRSSFSSIKRAGLPRTRFRSVGRRWRQVRCRQTGATHPFQRSLGRHTSRSFGTGHSLLPPWHRRRTVYHLRRSGCARYLQLPGQRRQAVRSVVFSSQILGTGGSRSKTFTSTAS